MKYILLQKQEPFVIITITKNQYTNIKAQTANEVQPLENYENSTIVFDGMLISRQESNIDMFFTRDLYSNTEIFYISQNYFQLPKNTFRITSNIIILFEQTRRIIL